MSADDQPDNTPAAPWSGGRLAGSVPLYAAPASERWFIERLARSVATLVVNPELSAPERRAVLRLLLGLQRFPLVTPGLNVGLSWAVMEGVAAIHIRRERIEFSYCSTTLQYFVGSHQLFHGASTLEGAERERFLCDWASVILHIDEYGNDLSVEDLSEGEAVDVPYLLARECVVGDEGELDLL